MSGLIGLDWGTSSLRAMRLSADGRLRASRTRPWGIRRLPPGGFDAALDEIVDGWPPLPTLASGMVGSRQGWREVPYVDLPADVDAFARHLQPLVSAGGRRLWIVPGARDARGPDVMRGEETQVIGALDGPQADVAPELMVLPGTHSKWVVVRGGAMVSFHTMMTGELYGLLCQHSILAADVPATSMTAATSTAFDAAVKEVRDGGDAGALTRLFSTRALQLEGRLSADAVPDRLSGLMIGEEIRAAVAAGWLPAGGSVVLIGESALCARYRRAFELFDRPPPAITEDAAARGLWRIAAAAARAGRSELDGVFQ